MLKHLPLLFLFFGCVIQEYEFEEESEPQYYLELYMNHPIENNIYRINYPSGRSNSYTTVYVQSHPNVFIDWYSDDDFCVDFMNQNICESIIQYSTYTRTDGSGQQMIYLSENFIGDTLSVSGCINEYCNEVRFIVD
jgi:hypothetical protein